MRLSGIAFPPYRLLRNKKEESSAFHLYILHITELFHVDRQSDEHVMQLMKQCGKLWSNQMNNMCESVNADGWFQ